MIRRVPDAAVPSHGNFGRVSCPRQAKQNLARPGATEREARRQFHENVGVVSASIMAALMLQLAPCEAAPLSTPFTEAQSIPFGIQQG